MPELQQKLGGLPFVIGGLSFIPLLGLPFGLIALVWGLTTKKAGGKKLALTAIFGIMFTLALYGGMFYFGFAKRGGLYDELRARSAQNSLNGLVATIELYKTQHGEYPETLSQLESSLPKNSPVFLTDSTDVSFSHKPRYFYYQRAGHDHYYLRSVGPDGVPFTSDDILPQVKPESSGHIGLLLEPENAPRK